MQIRWQMYVYLMTRKPGEHFKRGKLTDNFNLQQDTVVEMHDIETIKFKDDTTGVEIGSKGKLRVALDYHNRQSHYTTNRR